MCHMPYPAPLPGQTAPYRNTQWRFCPYCGSPRYYQLPEYVPPGQGPFWEYRQPYVSDGLGVNAYDDTGATENLQQVVDHLSSGRQTVVAASLDGYIYLIDLASGRLTGSFEIGSGIQASPAISGGMIFVGTIDGTFYALGGRE